MEKSGNKFEKQWKDKFQEAETTPREEVWTRIESNLANQQINKYKKTLLVYKLLAAASIVLALGIGFFTTTDLFKSENDTSTVAEDQETPVLDVPDSEENISLNTTPSVTENQQFSTSDREELVKNTIETEKIIRPSSDSPKDTNTILASDEQNLYPDGSIAISDRSQYTYSMPQLITRFNSDYKKPRHARSPQKKVILYADDWLFTFEDPREKQDERRPEFWAGLNFSSGFFNPNISYGSGSSNLGDQLAFMSSSSDAFETVPSPDNNISNIMRAAQPEETTYNPEFSYGYGINVGYKITPKFIVRSGVSYLYSNSSTQINSYIENSATNKKEPNQALYSAQIESAGVTSLNSSAEEIKLNSTYEFISLPVNFGYYLIDRKIEWMLTAGITTDLFLKNRIYDPGNFLDSKEIRPGENSPYNRSYLNGMLGTLINISFADQYLFSLEPSYRLGLSSFAKEGASFTSRPTSFKVAIGISYIFK